MLAYRHSYHAGNFADVLKHMVQVAIIDYLKRKDKPFTIHDTHAGAGCYQVDSEHMRKTAEFEQGIARLYGQRYGVPAVDRYLTLVENMNPVGRLLRYPGSPAISAAMVRDQDVMQCTELHSTDVALLQKLFAGDRRVHVHHRDAWQGIKSLLPPRHRRGLVIIDPSYEMPADYADVVSGVKEGLRRFPTGIFAVWYPVLERNRAENLVRQMVAAQLPDMLRLECCVRADAPGHGMTGSGMLVINPPYVLAQQMAQAMPVLKSQLCNEGGSTLIKTYNQESREQ